jgi:hypothetical protein
MPEFLSGVNGMDGVYTISSGLHRKTLERSVCEKGHRRKGEKETTRPPLFPSSPFLLFKKNPNVLTC